VGETIQLDDIYYKFSGLEKKQKDFFYVDLLKQVRGTKDF